MQKGLAAFSAVLAMPVLRSCMHQLASCPQLTSSVTACTQSLHTNTNFTKVKKVNNINVSNSSNNTLITRVQQKSQMQCNRTHRCYSSLCSSFRRKSPHTLSSSFLSSPSSCSLFSLHISGTAMTQQCQHYSTPGKVKVTITTPDHTNLDLESDCNMSLMSFIRDCGLFTQVCCTGVMHCGTCHVYVDPAWMSKVGKPSQQEQDMLDQCPDPKETSRLSCQIKLTEQLDGLHVTLPEHTVNLMYSCPANSANDKQ